jgi:hypothetical protein
MSHETINPSLPADHPFTNIFTGYYWTSTTCSRLPNQAWYIHLGGARVFKGMKYNSYMTWPVRLPNPPDTKLLKTGQKDCYSEHGGITNCCDTGQDGEFQSGLPFNSPRFTEHDNFLYDNATGLTWFKNANFHHKMSDWKSALDLIETINRECKFGYDDWRMPTIRELESLTDMSRYSQALPADHLFVNVKEFYWSSTTSMYDTHYAWVLYMTDGAVGVGYKPLAEFYLWPVRGK